MSSALEEAWKASRRCDRSLDALEALCAKIKNRMEAEELTENLLAWWGCWDARG